MNSCPGFDRGFGEILEDRATVLALLFCATLYLITEPDPAALALRVSIGIES